MTTPEKYEKIKEAVFDGCPGLLGLSFGCKIKMPGAGIYTIVCVFPGKPREVLMLNELGDEIRMGMVNIELSSTIQILGHEITIASVLRALGILYAISGNGVLLERRIADSAYYCVGMPQWDLSHDSLSWHLENRPEVVEFLYDILFPNS